MTTANDDPSADDAPAREPITDTWRWKQDAASWASSLTVPDGDVATVNAAVHDHVARLLEDFTPLARVRAAMVLGDEPVRLASTPGEMSYAAFRAQLLEEIRTHPAPVIEVALDVDLRVWFRTAEAPDRPVLAWLSFAGTQLVISIDHDAHDGWAAFELTQTLFSAFTYPDRDPNPLHALDQPRLEDALRRWSDRTGERLQMAGELPGREERGFSSDPAMY